MENNQKHSWQEIAKYQKVKDKPRGIALMPKLQPGPVKLTHVQGGADIVNSKFANCGANPNAQASDGGGKKLTNCRVNLIFWGDAWGLPPTPDIATIVNDAASIVTGPYLSALTQYGCYGTFIGAILRTAPGENPPLNYTMNDVENFVVSAINGGGLPEPDEEQTNNLHMVFMPPGSNPPPNLGGEHSYASYTDYDFPFDLDWEDKSHCGFVAFGPRTQISALFSHELAEALTDPEGDGIQINPRNNSNWNEISDVCQNCLGVLNGVIVEPYWSQIDQACVIPVNVVSEMEITCIIKHAPNRYDPIPIWAVGGTNHSTNQPFFMLQTECIGSIDRGNHFFVSNPAGGTVDVKVFTRGRKANGLGFDRYIATVPDNTKKDNLLELPDCKIIPPPYGFG